MRLRTLRKVKESRSRSSRIIDIIRFKQLLKQHYNIVILLYYDYGAIVRHPLALQQPLPQNTPISTIFTTGEWSYLHTQACYRQKWGTKRSARQWSFRQNVIRPSNSTTATIRTKGGYFPRTVGYFPTKKTETIDLETVVHVLKIL